QDADRVADGVRDALADQRPGLRNERFAQLFGQANQTQTVWFVADVAAFGGIQPLSGQVEENFVLAPFFNHADSVYGGIQFNKDAEALIYVEIRDLIHADQFEQEINDLILLGKKREREGKSPASLRPLERCLAKADMKRQD